MMNYHKLRLAVGTLVAVGVIVFLLPSISFAQGWDIETVDTMGDVGEHISLALDSNGYPHISYFQNDHDTNQSNDALKYARYDGSNWQIQTVESGNAVGRYGSLVLDDNDLPHISYVDYGPNDLRYAYFDGSSWQLQTIDSTSAVEWETSMTLDSNGYPHIAYYGSQSLKYTWFDGNSWQFETVDSNGRFMSLALDNNNLPHISYWDADESEWTLEYAHFDGNNWQIQIPYAGTWGGQFTSLALDSTMRPHISFYDDYTDELGYVRFDGTAWQAEIVDSAGDVGLFTSLALDSNDLPHISYLQRDNFDLGYAHFDGSSWQIETVDTPGEVGRDTSLMLDATNNPHIGYWDYTNRAVKYTKKMAPGPYVISSTVPAANAIAVPGSQVVTAVTSRPTDANTVNTNSLRIQPQFSGLLFGTYTISGSTITLDADRAFRPGEVLDVVATAGIQSIDGTALEPYLWQFRAATAPATATFPISTTFSFDDDHASSVVLGDIDKDGDLDVMVGRRFQKNQIFFNSGNGSLAAGGYFSVGNDDTWIVVAGDVDGDSDLDLVTGNLEQPNRIFFNDGTGTFPTYSEFGPANSATNGLALGDVDADGDIDIVEGNLVQQNQVYLNNGAGGFPTALPFGPNNDRTRKVLLGDIDNDGDLDIAVSNIWQNTFYINDGGGSFSQGSNFGNNVDDSRGLALGDLDNDGDLDVVVGNDALSGTGQNIIAINDGTGAFPTTIPFGTGQDRTASVALGDVDGDGDLDIVVGNSSLTDSNVIYVNDGSGNITEARLYDSSDATQSVALGDLNGDGALDIAVAKYVELNQVHLNTTLSAAGSLSVQVESFFYLPLVQR